MANAAADQRNRKDHRPKASVKDGKFDLDALLHPAKAFAHPMNVVRDPDLTLNEKRAILASWASDACAVEAAPELRATASGRVGPLGRHYGRCLHARPRRLRKTAPSLQAGPRGEARRPILSTWFATGSRGSRPIAQLNFEGASGDVVNKNLKKERFLGLSGFLMGSLLSGRWLSHPPTRSAPTFCGCTRCPLLAQSKLGLREWNDKAERPRVPEELSKL